VRILAPHHRIARWSAQPCPWCGCKSVEVLHNCAVLWSWNPTESTGWWRRRRKATLSPSNSSPAETKFISGSAAAESDQPGVQPHLVEVKEIQVPVAEADAETWGLS